METLINAPSISPRLAWLTRHKLLVRHAKLPHTFVPCDQTKEWLCANSAMTTVGFGDDEREATFDYARKAGVKHWLLADWERAMSAVPGVSRNYASVVDSPALTISGDIEITVKPDNLDD